LVKNRKKNFGDGESTIIVEEEELEGLAGGRLLDLAHSISEDDQNPG
jgi:hypothetical protein